MSEFLQYSAVICFEGVLEEPSILIADVVVVVVGTAILVKNREKCRCALYCCLSRSLARC